MHSLLPFLPTLVTSSQPSNTFSSKSLWQVKNKTSQGPLELHMHCGNVAHKHLINPSLADETRFIIAIARRPALHDMRFPKQSLFLGATIIAYIASYRVGYIGAHRHRYSMRAILYQHMRNVWPPHYLLHCMQREGFASDSLRMVREVKKGKTEANKVQILLFSATFADDIKQFAQSVIGEQANEVSVRCFGFIFVVQDSLCTSKLAICTQICKLYIGLISK